MTEAARTTNHLGDLSRYGRRVVAAVVDGEAGERIQRWREVHDPRQAARLPPHLTLCYWAPRADADLIERQVRHAFPEPVEVYLGGVKAFRNPEQTRYVEVLQTDELDAARARLYDGTYVPFPEVTRWRWHVTLVRYAHRVLAESVGAADRWSLDTAWTLSRFAYLELTPHGWEWLGEWRLEKQLRESA
jgi:2'-5' RNA ligase